MARAHLLDALWRRQGEEGMADAAFARHLGIDPANLHRWKEGGAGRRDGLIEKAVQRYPEYAALLALPEDAGEEEPMERATGPPPRNSAST